MTTLRKYLVFGIAGAVIVPLATWLMTTVTGQQPRQVANGLFVCVGPDSVLRVPKGACPPDSSPVTLDQPRVEKVEPPDDEDSLDPNSNAKKPGGPNSEEVVALERRIEKLENRSQFQVVDEENNVIFSVAPGSVQVYNEGQTPVAAMLATSEGGEYVTRSVDGSQSAYIGTYGARAGLRLKEGNLSRLELLRQTAGNYAFRLPSANGVIAGIGESQAGSGALIIGDIGGQKRAGMIVGQDSKGIIGIFNGSGNAILSLTEGATGGGLFVIGNPNSAPMVKMGVKADRYGVVLAGPRAGFPLIPSSGLPGSYILGCAAGLACRP